jgi:hypothetical protein
MCLRGLVADRSRGSSPGREIDMRSVVAMVACLLAAETARADEPRGWSLQPIRRPELPRTASTAELRTAVDVFVQAELERRGLTLAGEADRTTLIRRLTFDLHGLPPTPDEVDAFLRDTAANAYDRLVDRLLDSPRYGERWGRHWLDVVRFSESKGFERDRIRANAWHYRDYVIRALNDDKPYADFICEQIAGDALRPDDPQAAIATGFLVTGPNNDVGNQSKLELLRERADELDEIVSNVGSVFLGLTVACARCHDHKFDPIPTRDYYRLAAVFSGVKFDDRPLAAAEPSRAVAEQLAAHDRRLGEITKRLADINAQIADLGAGELNPQRNEERFEPIEAQFVRFTIERTNDGTEPGLDELELYEASGDNQALASRGAKATASSLLPGYAIHQVAHLNDGQVGNSHSWISNERGVGWAQIELPRPARLARIVWGRDRAGQFRDRLAVEYRIEYSLDGRHFQRLATRADRPATPESVGRLAELRTQRQSLHEERQRINDAKAKLDGLPKAWAAVSGEPVPLKVLKRGDVLTPGDDAPPAALSALPLTGELGIQPADTEPQRRLKLAQWIADPANPLTWRVIVNRLWHYHFGAGLVLTPSDLGATAAPPSHPDLLDWLADELRRDGGRLKALHRLIVRSATYRQSSGDGPAAAVDAGNRLLWRMNRRRLDAESLRDSILAVAGTLDGRAGGPSYRPFHYIEGNIPVYEVLAERPEFWRRTVYRHTVRTHRSPLLDAFDCPDSSVMTPARSQTTTPLQALGLLNNAFVLEQSRYFAERVMRESGSEPAAQVHRAYRLALLRAPSEPERAEAVSFVTAHRLEDFCRVLFNTNEFLYVD